MKIWFTLSRFAKDDQAAVTIDWVMLTAGIAFVGLSIVVLVSNTLDDNATIIADEITATVATALS